jgi:hypothetical protein
VTQANSLTCQYLDDFFTALFSLSLTVDFTGLTSCTSSGSSSNTISYQLVLGFGSTTNPVPATSDIDVSLIAAFSQPSNTALITALGGTTGSFATTTGTVF